MGVRTIFTVLILTIVLIVCSSLFIEYINVSSTGLQISNSARIGVRKAAEYFGQETYRRPDYTGVDAPQLFGQNEGGQFLYLTGDFYPGTDLDSTYNALYSINPGSPFREWYDTEVRNGNYWQNTLGALMNDTEADSLGALYRELRMTPLNMGIAYIDRDVLTNIARWNVARILSDGMSENIRTDDNGENYVNFRGFRVYAHQLAITNLEYEVVDILANPNRIDEVTNIEGQVLADNIGGIDDRRYVMLVGIEFSIPVSYQGVTPMRQVMEFIWNYRVAGMNRDVAPDNPNVIGEDNLSMLQLGGIEGNTTVNSLPIPGKLVYTLIR